MKIFALLLTLALALPVWAEELEHFPGWKINKIEPADREDGSIESGPEYYGLTPPDKRPPVTIDARTARALKAGQAQPEEVYGRLAPKSAKADTQAGTDSYEYSAGNNGFVQADTIASTLPGYVVEPGGASASPKRGGDSFGAGATASYGGSGASVAGESGSSVGYAAGNAGGSYGVGAGEGGMSYALKDAAAAASPAAAQAEAREKIERMRAGAKDQGDLASNGLNVKSGFDALGAGSKKGPGRGKDGNKDGNKDENTRTLASGGVEEAPPPPCPQGRFVYESATYVRLKLPEGCGMILIRAWGAGGGSGFQSWGGSSEAENAYETPGGGASFMSTSWQIDARKYDLIVVVGEPGGSAKKKTVTVKDDTTEGGTRTVTTFEGGEGGFPEGKGGSTGGGGGGFSGVFLVPKNDGSKTLSQSRAMAVANGGSGGGGGGAGGAMAVPSSAPSAHMSNQIGEKGSGARPGFYYYSERGSAGSPGSGGKVIVEYY